jgi:hypothetical protein
MVSWWDWWSWVARSLAGMMAAHLRHTVSGAGKNPSGSGSDGRRSGSRSALDGQAGPLLRGVVIQVLLRVGLGGTAGGW